MSKEGTRELACNDCIHHLLRDVELYNEETKQFDSYFESKCLLLKEDIEGDVLHCTQKNNGRVTLPAVDKDKIEKYGR